PPASEPFLLFYPAVVLGAWYGGRGPGLLSTGLGALLGWPLFFPPAPGLRLASPLFADLLAFLAVGALVSALSERMHRSRADRERSRAREIEAHERLRATLRGVGEGVVATDLDGRITFLNPAAEVLTGWAEAEAN